MRSVHLIMDARSASVHVIFCRCFYRFLPARRRPSGIVVSGVCLSVCVCVCAHCFCPQDISRTGSWITTKFGGWEQGVNL